MASTLPAAGAPRYGADPGTGIQGEPCAARGAPVPRCRHAQRPPAPARTRPARAGERLGAAGHVGVRAGRLDLQPPQRPPRAVLLARRRVRPPPARAHPEGVLLMTNGVACAVLFWGRQLAYGGDPDATGIRWAAWLGVWPIAINIALGTLAVLCFPDGRLASPRWRPVAAGVVALAVVCSTLSMLWPVEYASTEVTLAAPVRRRRRRHAATALWTVLAHPAYTVFQLLWPVAIWARWRSASGWVRRQLAWLLLAAAGAALVLVVGLVGWGTPTPGLIAVTMVPVAAGLAVVHGQHAAAYAALTWMSRRGPAAGRPADRPRAGDVGGARGAGGALARLGRVPAAGRRLAADARRPGTPRRAAAGLPADRPRRRPRRRPDGRPGRPHCSRVPDPRRPRGAGVRWSCSTSRWASWSSRSDSPGTSRA